MSVKLQVEIVIPRKKILEKIYKVKPLKQKQNFNEVVTTLYAENSKLYNAAIIFILEVFKLCKVR